MARLRDELDQARELAQEADPELVALAKADLARLPPVITGLEAELPGQIRTARPTRLIGTAGTATTLAALDLALPRYDAARVQGHVLRRSALDACRQCLARLTLAERAALPCLEPGRADLIVPGLAIVMATMECLAMEAMQVSDWGLREGIIAEMLAGAS